MGSFQFSGAKDQRDGRLGNYTHPFAYKRQGVTKRDKERPEASFATG